DTRLGRWFVPDKYASKYPGHSPYNYVLNSPLSATDPDGNLVMFIGGLRLWEGQGDQRGYGYPTKTTFQGIANNDVTHYWSTAKGETNSFGRSASIDKFFINKIGDNNAWYTSGSSSWRSQPWKRMEQGAAKAQQFHAMV